MVCAHRYTRRGLDYRWGQGQCFTLTNKLKFDETWEPCRGRDTYRSGHMIHNVLPVSMYMYFTYVVGDTLCP